MPIARFKGVFICSSEDKHFPANNLIQGANKKWKCEEIGLDSVYVILQLEHATKINGIDIGNEHSAFIEVSVGRNGWPIEKYKTILVNSSFMTVPDCRNSESPNRVRCFAKDALMPDVLDETWDLIKITCKQTFNRHVQYGLSFVKVYTHDAIPSASASPMSAVCVASPKQQKSCDEILGLPKDSVFSRFKIRSDSSDSDKESEASSSLFSKWKQERDSPKKASNGQSLSAAAAIREASSSMSKLEECTKITYKIDTSRLSMANKSFDEKEAKKERMDRYRPAILYDNDDETTSKPKHEKLINQDKERIEEERKRHLDKKKLKKEPTREEKSKQKLESSADKFKMFLTDEIADKPAKDAAQSSSKSQDDDDKDDVEINAPNVDLTSSPQAAAASSSDTSAPPAWKPKAKRPSTSTDQSANKRPRNSTSAESDASDDNFDQILRGVVFVISGIQNPDRAEMRERGLQMGAIYKPDWNDSCTHLICAFRNTPKYKQVYGQGIIVNKRWINDCHAQKKKLPWQDYQL